MRLLGVDTGQLHRWNLKSGELLQSRGLEPALVTKILVLPGERYAVCIDLVGENVYRRHLRLRDLKTGVAVREIEIDGSITEAVELSRDGSRLLVGNSRGDLLIYDTGQVTP